MNEVDEKALHILRKYNVTRPEDTLQADFIYAKDKGLMFDKENIDHDKAVRACFEIFSDCRKEHFTNLFLASLSSNRLDYRSGLAAYAIMQTFPHHQFDMLDGHYCKLCSYPKQRVVDLSALNNLRFFCGGLFSGSPAEISFFLLQHQKLSDVYPNTLDFEIFGSILQTIRRTDQLTTISTLQKQLKNILSFKATKEQIKVLLETLGYCGVLQTPSHEGLLHRYVNISLAPRKTRSSDWKYPVDFWTGKDGVNRDNFMYWFGHYKELKQQIN
ncbi:hypothetical protein [Methylomonas sp. YC3]